MKTEDQIRARLIDDRIQMKELMEWHERAYQTYLQDRKIWGRDAERGEMEHVSDLMTALNHEIMALEWTLDIQKHYQNSTKEIQK